MKRFLQNIAVVAVPVLLLLWSSTPALAQGPGSATLPRILNYQGVLTDDGRRAVSDGPYTMTFRIYTEAAGGAPIWSETQTVTTLDGVFDVYLGEQTALDVPFDRGYWISAQVEGQPEMTPRTRLVAAPYSISSGTAIGLIGGYVRSLNGEQGEVVLIGGTGVDVTVDNGNIEISSAQATLGEGEIWYGNANDQPITLPIGTPGEVLNVNGAGNAPEWTSDLRVTTISVRSIDVDTVQVNDYINIDGNAVFNDTATFNGVVNINGPVNWVNLSTDSLTHKSIVVGDAANRMSELPTTNTPGALLQQGADGTPFWGQDLTVRNVTVNGDNFDVNSQTINFGPANSTTTFEGLVIFNQRPRLPLQEGHIIVGDAAGFEAEYAPGTNGQILQIVNGIPTWSDGGSMLPEGTDLNTTLRWNGTEWVENLGLRADENGNTTVGGSLRVNDIRPNSTAGEVLVSNNGVVESRTVASLLPGLPLTQHHIWVGAFGNRPSELAPGTNGQVLTAGPNGAPSWKDPLGLDDLSTNSMWFGDANDKPIELASPGTGGYLLQTDATGTPTWDNRLTIDSLTVNVDLQIGGNVRGAGNGNFSGAYPIPQNAYLVNVPYASIQAGASVTVSIQDTDNSVGNVTHRVSQITPGVGFAVELSIFYPTTTGRIDYIVVNP